MVRSRVVAIPAITMLVLGGCGGGSKPRAATRPPAVTTTLTVATAPPRPAQPAFPQVLGGVLGTAPTAGFVPAVSWRGQTAVQVARTQQAVTLLSFDQRVVQLHLHSGTVDAGAGGWRYGPSVTGSELPQLAAAFNSGFKFSTHPGGFESYGRTAVPLRDGLGSIVTYADGSTDVGSWHREVPSPGRSVVSVRQNLSLLIDHGSAASTTGCLSCWGATLNGVPNPARSALGITADGHMIWAGGEHVTTTALADALLSAHVVRAVELDINPEWVAAYLYRHSPGPNPPVPVPVVPGQQGIPGQFLSSWSRDFFTFVVR